MKKFIAAAIVIILFSFPTTGYSQASEMASTQDSKPYKLRPFRIGAKLGFPNLVGGNLEYVTPLLNNRLAVNLDYSMIKSSWLEPSNEENYNVDDSDQLQLRYIEIGINYYFFKPGKGLYGSFSYGMIRLDGTLADMAHSEDSQKRGIGMIDQGHNSFNVKLGARWGGLFYFRPEVGYMFNTLPKSLNVDVVFPDGSRETQTEEFEIEAPFDLLFTGFIANIGIGFAF
ncbi:hypothetical protein FHG64_02945 [Antarcticibacterium flavum]|uniref:Outer membrane protein beta-barrel domain-containing protein n=1 Tax=Antarcticibacterium flavum TaxID=2058175 RepID=A0A5B7X181_9FLAO|nr:MULTISPECIES: hypothetical protein [Antarcticibacterium]MCM4161255.1 hypothetical protein [Antarcticibacterium sp. W02-3]QCY68428.1 hypothetical protein FHG64_02945 [Antarcticibacterium flavum]